MGKILEASVFLALLYPLIFAFGLTGAAWTGIIAIITPALFLLLIRADLRRRIIADRLGWHLDLDEPPVRIA